jgi:hypothetical protein
VSQQRHYLLVELLVKNNRLAKGLAELDHLLLEIERCCHQPPLLEHLPSHSDYSSGCWY